MSPDGIIPGQTPLHDLSGLVPKHLRTRVQRDAAEAENIRRATLKYLAATPSPRDAPLDSERLGCRRCKQPIGSSIPHNCPECGAPLDPSDSRTVIDLARAKRRRQSLVALAMGVLAGAALGFGWWCVLTKHNRAIPVLNQIVPIALLMIPPAVIATRRERMRNACSYAIGSTSFVGWGLLAVAVDQLRQGASLNSLDVSVASSLKVGLPVVVIAAMIGLGAGVLWRFVASRFER